ncbi:hypothetical protein HMPREF0298_1632 [Corynebacterium lipophiloflavum DSM 44291]|uniref:Uncharacterized protein n=1 Tax=Corynebacterium lipophiloflavum (strain ATCC 700352 / DSM 44291 / CCUG 37336 / JCM 10383 / DMMZ 1944) TaxID=525263 RepID=C0XT62_CORLD|nr:hypothetical protein HMPREF0298_1632 [Corynebacterium lipophiloflavum DSM 44291]
MRRGVRDNVNKVISRAHGRTNRQVVTPQGCGDVQSSEGIFLQLGDEMVGGSVGGKVSV